MGAQQVSEIRSALVDFATQKPLMAKATVARRANNAAATPQSASTPAVVLAYKPAAKKAMPAKASLKALSRPRHAIAAAR